MLTNLIAAVLAVSLAPAKIELEVDAKDGAVIKGEHVFKVLVKSDHPVTQVEFYVGDDLRETDQSTPYEFRLDTLAESEGSVKLMFAAYSSEGENAKKTITVTVNNELPKGADAHVAMGRDALQVSKWDEAMYHARVALKIQAGYNPARMVMARANYGKGVLDLAQKFAEDVVATDAANVEALELLAGINLRKAFSAVARGGSDRNETLKLVSSSLKTAIANRKKSLETQFEKMGPPTDANWKAYDDAAIRAGRYSLALMDLRPRFTKDNTDFSIANRLVYSQLRSGRVADAGKTMETFRKYGTFDGYGYGLSAALYGYFGDEDKAREAEKEAILGDGESLGVRTIQAYLALRRNDAGVLSQLARRLAETDSQVPEVQYYLACVNYMQGDYEPARRAFEASILAEPVNPAMLVERGNQAILQAQTFKPDTPNLEQEKGYQYAYARAMFEAALEARPESFEALTAMALLSLYENKTADALSWARAAVASGPDYAAAHYALSAALGMSDRTAREAEKEAEKAGKLDPPNLEGRSTPGVGDAFVYFYRHGRFFVFVAPR